MLCVPACQLERPPWCMRENVQTVPAQPPADAVHLLIPVFPPNQPWIANYLHAPRKHRYPATRGQIYREEARPAALSLWRRFVRRERVEDEPPMILVSWSSRSASSR